MDTRLRMSADMWTANARREAERLEVACRRFAILSGIEQEPDNYSICVQPLNAAWQRKGMLMLATEPAGSHPALSVEACRVAQDVLVQHYYMDNSLSLTSGLLKALA